MTDTTYAAVTRHGTDHSRVDENEFLNLPAAVRHARSILGTEPSLVAVIEGDELARLVDHDGEGVLHTLDELRDIAEQIGLAGVADDPERNTRRGFPGHAVPRRDGNRRAVVTVSRDFLAHSFGLPDGIRVVAVGVDERRDAILLKVEGDDLPEADPLAHPPEFGEATVYQLHGHEGHDWYRIEWTRG